MHYIFEVHLRSGLSPEAYAESWIAASRMIQQAPGAQGTRLHRKIGDPKVLPAIATWESKEARDSMEAFIPAEVISIFEQQAPFIEVRLIGEFDAPEWVVLPHAGEEQL